MEGPGAGIEWRVHLGVEEGKHYRLGQAGLADPQHPPALPCYRSLISVMMPAIRRLRCHGSSGWTVPS